MHAQSNWSHLDILGTGHTSQVGDPSPVDEGSDLLACQSDGGHDDCQFVVDGTLLFQL